MESDFAAARAHLESAFEHLRGTDRISLEGRELIGILLDAIIAIELSRRDANVIPFRAPR